MTEIQQAIKDARPKLKSADPKTYYISWAFVWFNYAIGAYFWTTPLGNLHVPVVTPLLNNYVWGVLFASLAFWLMAALVDNDWPAIRRAMIGGLFVKAFWAYALIFLAFDVGFWRTLANMAMWFFIAAVQAIVVIHFLPKDIKRQNGRSDQ